MSDDPVETEARRLERLWSGQFGDDYIDRNLEESDEHRAFWTGLLHDLHPGRVLEVGCNLGGNLQWIAPELPAGAAYGVDINAKALSIVQQRVPQANAILSRARTLPFRDRRFDLVFTMGVLIHQPDDTLPIVMSEMIRTSNRYILCGEYYAETPTAVPYRGVDAALFRRDYGALFQRASPDLRMVREGFMGRDVGWDDITWWLFERT